MNTELSNDQAIMNRLMAFIKAGGPNEHEYEELTGIWNRLNAISDGAAGASTTREFLASLFGKEFMDHTVQGFGYRKPHGYAGDFEIIDYIYQQKSNTDKRFQKWDRYLHSQLACKAVINRKTYFIQLVKQMISRLERPIRVLNIASGPCRDVLELLQQVPSNMLNIECVEIDNNAIAYARHLLGDFAHLIKFTRASIFKYTTTEQFDLVWSAGLFDYFSDCNFISLVTKIYSFCNPSGEVVVGNFSTFNPSRSYMELATNWHLFHRTPAELIDLARQAGVATENSTVKTEPLRVNLFLHLKK